MLSLWYVIHCEPRLDLMVERVFTDGSVEAFAPRIPRARRRDGDKPLFPGYLFARMDLDTGVWGRMRFMPGVRALVEMGGMPCPVDEGIVAAIRRRVAGWSAASTPVFHEGERVRVVGGSFEHLEGLFSESLSGEERAAVLLDMMERQVRVELHIDHLERVA